MSEKVSDVNFLVPARRYFSRFPQTVYFCDLAVLLLIVEVLYRTQSPGRIVVCANPIISHIVEVAEDPRQIPGPIIVAEEA